jgi:hypothetical protein
MAPKKKAVTPPKKIVIPKKWLMPMRPGDKPGKVTNMPMKPGDKPGVWTNLSRRGNR